MTRLLQSNWVAAAIGALVFLGTTCFLLNPQNLLKEAQAELRTPVAAESNPGIGWDFNNPEIDQLIADLKQEKENLATREQQLKELATRLAAERAEINQATQAVSLLQREFDSGVARVREEEIPNLKKLAKVYAAMSTEGAVAIIKQLPDEQVVKILVFMKEAEAAPILEAIGKTGEADAKRAALISERLRMAAFRSQSARAATSQ